MRQAPQIGQKGRLACQWARDEKNARARLIRGPSPGRLGEARVSDPTLGIDATPVCLRARSRPAVAGAIVLGLAVLLLAIAPGRAAAQSANSFRQFVEELWPDAQAHGRLARHLRQRLPRRRARPVHARPRAAGQDQERREGPGRVHPHAGRISERLPSRPPRRAGPSARSRPARRGARQDRAGDRRAAAMWCSPSGGARPRSARTARPTTPSRCWPRRPGSAAARTCSATSCCMPSRCSRTRCARATP